jgi:hypothetical protein
MPSIHFTQKMVIIQGSLRGEAPRDYVGRSAPSGPFGTGKFTGPDLIARLRALCLELLFPLFPRSSRTLSRCLVPLLHCYCFAFMYSYVLEAE